MTQGNVSLPTLTNNGLGLIRGVKNIPYVQFPNADYGTFSPVIPTKNASDVYGEIFQNSILNPEVVPKLDSKLVNQISKKIGYNIIYEKSKTIDEVVTNAQCAKSPDSIYLLSTTNDEFYILANCEHIEAKEFFDLCRKIKSILEELKIGNFISCKLYRIAGNSYKIIEEKIGYIQKKTNLMFLRDLKEKGKKIYSVSNRIHKIFGRDFFDKVYDAERNIQVYKHLDSIVGEKSNGDNLYIAVLNDLVDFEYKNKDFHYIKTLKDFDSWLGNFYNKLNSDDKLIIVGILGCDNQSKKNIYTFERGPVFIYKRNIEGKALGDLSSDDLRNFF